MHKIKLKIVLALLFSVHFFSCCAQLENPSRIEPNGRNTTRNGIESSPKLDSYSYCSLLGSLMGEIDNCRNRDQRPSEEKPTAIPKIEDLDDLTAFCKYEQVFPQFMFE